jgi:hypothetical protein
MREHRETIAIHHADDMSKDELDNLKLGYESKGWTKVQVLVTERAFSKLFTVSGFRPEPSKSIDFVNVTSREPSKTELVEILEDHGIAGAKIDYWTEPYAFEDAFQISTVYYTK